jgi:serine/threonine-protein kinase
LRFVPAAVATSLAALRSRPDWRVLASLTHDGIARLLDAGETGDGRVYIVSELVEGRPLDRYCDEKELTIDERLALFLDVCQAVQYAHRKLAVHGGINPSNVVVTAEGGARILDFGIAGLLAVHGAEADDGLFPRIPSLDFASPEQVRGEPLAVASDVYQLGLLLYVLVTGEQASSRAILPSARAASADGRNAAARGLRPRALVRKLRGDLDAIVMYALRTDADRRYPSVSLLQSDIQRYRTRLPVWAQSDTPWYRFRKFVLRRRAPVAAAIAALLVGGATLPGPIADRMRASRETARVAGVERLLASMFASPGTRTTVDSVSALEYVDHAAKLARAELGAMPKSQARIFTGIGRAYGALGHYQRSIEVLEEALALRRTSFGDDSIEVADTLDALGQSRHHLGRLHEAETSLRTALAIRQVRAGATHQATIGTTIELAELLYTRGQLDAAEQMIRGATTALFAEVLEAPDEAPVHEMLPRALRGLANVLRDRGVLGESAALYRDAISMLRQHGREPNAQVAAARVDLSRLMIARSELGRAEAELAEALPALRRAHNGDHPSLGAALRDYAYLRLEQGRFDEAQELLTEAERVHEQWLGRAHPAVPQTRALRAELARRRGDMAAAIDLATNALEQFARFDLPDHPCTIDIRATLAHALIARGEFARANRVLTDALAAAKRLFVSYDPRIARLQASLVRAASARPAAPVPGRATGSIP